MVCVETLADWWNEIGCISSVFSSKLYFTFSNAICNSQWIKVKIACVRWKANKYKMRNVADSLSAQRSKVSLSNWAKWATFMPWLSSTVRHHTQQLAATPQWCLQNYLQLYCNIQLKCLHNNIVSKAQASTPDSTLIPSVLRSLRSIKQWTRSRQARHQEYAVSIQSTSNTVAVMPYAHCTK